MTKQSSIGPRENGWRVFRYTVLYLLDAGQVLKALFSKDYGWTPQVVAMVNNVVNFRQFENSKHMY